MDNSVFLRYFASVKGKKMANNEFDKRDYEVRGIDYDSCKEWLLYKHYAHRMPMICYSFGLFHRNEGELELVGVCTYGIPISKDLVQKAFQGNYTDKFLELNRLCVNDGLPRNALSFFVGQTLKMLPKPMVIVSYADSEHNHHGYIYQATNWIYTGLTPKKNDVKVRGFEDQHTRSILGWKLDGIEGKRLFDKLCTKFGAENVYLEERSRKYRYFALLGSKTERKRMRKLLKYKEEPYPKGDNIRYDSSYQCTISGMLF